MTDQTAASYPETVTVPAEHVFLVLSSQALANAHRKDDRRGLERQAIVALHEHLRVVTLYQPPQGPWTLPPDLVLGILHVGFPYRLFERVIGDGPELTESTRRSIRASAAVGVRERALRDHPVAVAFQTLWDAVEGQAPDAFREYERTRRAARGAAESAEPAAAEPAVPEAA